MHYQLPTGRVIYITVEQYLDLTDEDIQALIATNAGDYIQSPFHGSSIGTPKKPKTDPEDIDVTIDYVPEDDELVIEKPTIQDEQIIQELPAEESEEDSLT